MNLVSLFLVVRNFVKILSFHRNMKSNRIIGNLVLLEKIFKKSGIRFWSNNKLDCDFSKELPIFGESELS